MSTLYENIILEVWYIAEEGFWMNKLSHMYGELKLIKGITPMNLNLLVETSDQWLG